MLTQYLVMYQPNDQNEWFPSLHVWPEVLTMLDRWKEVDGSIKLYRLDKVAPERVWPVRVEKGIWYLEDMIAIM